MVRARGALLGGLIAAGGLLAVLVGQAILRERHRLAARCGPGFVADGARCAGCAPPLVVTPRGCEVPDAKVLIPATEVSIGPSDWEAEGRVPPRVVRVGAFRIDAFEATDGAFHPDSPDPMRAASGMTRDEAAEFCARRGGRLPSEDEWIAAASAPSSTGNVRRYPWGDSGAVCRRAAWGLARGPCARDARGPDTVGAHPDGDTPLGLHDMAGNVAEWVAPDPDHPSLGVAHGGSWASDLATELRIWARLELPPGARDPRVGVRCVYPPAP